MRAGIIHCGRVNRAEFVRCDLAAVLRHPAATAPDADDPQVRHAMAPIEEYGRRVLRVVYNEQVEPWRIVTAFFDRALKGRL